MFVENPDQYLLPSYRISPFQTKHIALNNQLDDNDAIDHYFTERFNGWHYQYTENGRQAINLALGQYKLRPTDVVTILTTSGNFYISSCVTKEIEKFCRWSRKIEADSKLIFVNHEFGFPYQDIQLLEKYNLPVIEDCAHSFFTNSIGIADHVIYSFPKMFPLQIGGLLVSKKNTDQSTQVKEENLRYIKNVLSFYISEEKSIINKRINNYQYLSTALIKSNIEERFDLEEGVVPGVFMFRIKDKNIDLDKLKTHLYAYGIQCSVFYGEQAFFIPVHQNLEREDLGYFAFAINTFLKSA